MHKIAVVSLSGGMDSTTLVLHYLSKRYHIQCISFNYDQKHIYELRQAKEFVKYLKAEGYPVNLTEVDLTSFSSLLDSALIQGNSKPIPLGHYAEETMKSTVVPNRNKIFSSFIQASALSLQNRFPSSEVIISLGIHSGDHDIYPDCRQVWRDADNLAFKLGNWGAEKITFEAPFLLLDKHQILEKGEYHCAELELSFDEVYKRTLTSYSPILRGNEIYSDCFSGSSVERVEAFIKLGRPDPLKYMDNNQEPISWDEVVSLVKPILEKK